MIDSSFDVSIGGIKYRIVKDEDSPGYNLRREPLRAPNVSLVQGSTGKFNLRPDFLEWSMTDWSGGEGQEVLSLQEPSSYWFGNRVDPFDEPGKLKLARAAVETKDSGGTNPFSQNVHLVVFRDILFALDRGGSPAKVYSWSPSTARWSAGTNLLDATANSLGGKATSDPNFIYMNDTGRIIKTAGETAGVVHNTDILGTQFGVASLGRYLYAVETSGPTYVPVVREIPKDGTPPVASTIVYQLYDGVASVNPDNGREPLVVGDNALFFCQNMDRQEVAIHKITPTTSAGAGSGRELVRFKGMRVLGMWYNLGFLYFIVRDSSTSLGKTQLLYLDTHPDRLVVGAVGFLRPHDTFIPSGTSGGVGTTDGESLTRTFFAYHAGDDVPNTKAGPWTLFQLDNITGAYAGLGELDMGTTGGNFKSITLFKGEVFAAGVDSAFTARVWRFLSTQFEPTGLLWSSINDFGLQDEKVLLSFILTTEPLPSDCSVQVEYQLNQDGVWLSAGTLSTDSATGATFVVSTADSTKKFRTLQTRLSLSNGSTNTQTPIVTGLSARTTVTQGVRVWTLMLDATDEDGQAQDHSWNGQRLLENIQTHGDSGVVVPFQDGYKSRLAGVFSTQDVVVDDYSVIQERPGEGKVRVVLREAT